MSMKAKSLLRLVYTIDFSTMRKIVAALFVFPAHAFSPEWLQQRVPGIWKLTGTLPFEPDIRSRLQGLVENENNKDNDSKSPILLKLNQDGTFKQCDEGYTEGKWISGNWQLVEDLSTKSNSHKLVLAMNRQYYGPQFDVVLDGCMEAG